MVYKCSLDSRACKRVSAFRTTHSKATALHLLERRSATLRRFYYPIIVRVDYVLPSPPGDSMGNIFVTVMSVGDVDRSRDDDVTSLSVPIVAGRCFNKGRRRQTSGIRENLYLSYVVSKFNCGLMQSYIKGRAITLSPSLPRAFLTWEVHKRRQCFARACFAERNFISRSANTASPNCRLSRPRFRYL